MSQQVLLSKLIPPMPSVNYMRRSGLTKKLSRSEQVKVTILHSGAGYGKSSALARFFADQNRLFSWYQITEEDDDVLPFLRHLLHSVKRVWPSFGENFQRWDSFSMFPKIEELNKLYTLFVNEFCKITEPFYIVLDDFHVVHHVFQINYILEKLIEFLPPTIHVVIATRIYPSWNSLRVLKMNGQLIECKEADFLFSAEEIQVLFEDYFNFHLSEQEVQNVLAVTEGWAMAILLIAIQNTDSTISLHELTKLSLKDFFAYLSEEIFEGIGIQAQQSLLRYSIFQTFSYELIDGFYGHQEAQRLQDLVAIHAFMQPLTGHQEYRLHSLIQQFLEEKWVLHDSHQFYELHKNATQYFMDRNNIVQAMYHALKVKDEQYMGKMLVQHSQYFMKLGQFDWLLERIRELSPSCRKQFYFLYYVEGECQRFRAFYEKSKQAYEQCMLEAEKYEDELLILRANAGLAHIYLDTIQPAMAKNYLTNALELVEKVSLNKEEIHMLQRQFAENMVNLGFAKDAEEWVREKALPAHILRQGNLDVRIYLRQGKLQQAKDLIEKRAPIDFHLQDAHRESDVLLSLIYAMLGEGEDAKLSAIRGIENNQREHAIYGTAVAYLRKGHAELLVNPFDVDGAVKLYEDAIAEMDTIHVSRAKAEAYMGLAIAKGRQGFVDEAIVYANMGLHETERVQDHWVSGLILLAFTILYFENENFELAKQTAEQALQLFQEGKDEYCTMVAHFWLARIGLCIQQETLFNVHFAAFTEILVSHGYDFFILKRTLFGPRDQSAFYHIMSYASQLGIGDYGMFAKWTFKEGIQYPAFDLQVKLLGPLSFWRNNQEINEKAWQRDKAKELFSYLYLHRNRFVGKEEIMQALWPQADEETMKRDFKVVYNALLKVLEPGRSAREESFYIIRKQSMYKMRGEPFIMSDIVYFESFAIKGLDEKNPIIAKDWLMQAAKLYEGELVEDRPQIEWIQAERQRIAQLYLQVMERLAQVNTRLKDFKQVIYWCEKILQYDRTWEEAYRLLMFGYYQLQNRPVAVKWYERCVETLQKELNIVPMESTEQMYEMITR